MLLDLQKQTMSDMIKGNMSNDVVDTTLFKRRLAVLGCVVNVMRKPPSGK